MHGIPKVTLDTISTLPLQTKDKKVETVSVPNVTELGCTCKIQAFYSCVTCGVERLSKADPWMKMKSRTGEQKTTSITTSIPEVEEWVGPEADTITPTMPRPMTIDSLPERTEEEIEMLANPVKYEDVTTTSGTKSYNNPEDFDDWDPASMYAGWF